MMLDAAQHARVGVRVLQRHGTSGAAYGSVIDRQQPALPLLHGFGGHGGQGGLFYGSNIFGVHE